MNNIEWKDGAVCYANGKQWFSHTGNYLMDSKIANTDTVAREVNGLKSVADFKLNEIITGDHVPSLELISEQMYMDVVEVFGLFGITKSVDHSGFCAKNSLYLTVCDDGYAYTEKYIDRKLAYSQIIAIGKLKRLMLERDSVERQSSYCRCKQVEIGESKLPKFNVETPMPEVKEPKQDNVKNPKHYQLIEGVESIEVIARSMTKEQWKGFCLGNMLKYRIRAGKKDALQQDIDKANFYGELYEMHKDKCYE